MADPRAVVYPVPDFQSWIPPFPPGEDREPASRAIVLLSRGNVRALLPRMVCPEPRVDVAGRGIERRRDHGAAMACAPAGRCSPGLYVHRGSCPAHCQPDEIWRPLLRDLRSSLSRGSISGLPGSIPRVADARRRDYGGYRWLAGVRVVEPCGSAIPERRRAPSPGRDRLG